MIYQRPNAVAGSIPEQAISCADREDNGKCGATTDEHPDGDQTNGAGGTGTAENESTSETDSHRPLILRVLVVINFGGMMVENTRASMLAACARWGCQYYEITEKTQMPRTPFSPASLKTLVFKSIALGADEAFILDADTVISESCHSPFESFPGCDLAVVQNGSERFGDWGGIKECESYEWNKVLNHYAPLQLPRCRSVMRYFNSGMMLVRGAKGKSLLAKASKICLENIGLGWHDQTPLNVVAAWLKHDGDLNVTFADETWNYIHPGGLPGWPRMQKFIYHFAGEPNRANKINEVIWRNS